VSHWKSNYAATNDEQLSKPVSKSERPLWSLNRQAYSSKRSFMQTEYQNTHGTYGHNPRNKLPHNAAAQFNEVNELSAGTSKASAHIPGYNGYIPKSLSNIPL
jgi:hypothetical protein